MNKIKEQFNSTLERIVYNAICQYLGEGEHIEFVDKYFDFCLPEGLKKKGWPKNTFVEVKYFLMYDTFSKMKMWYEKMQANKLVVITTDNDSKPVEINSVGVKGRDIEILTLDEFVKLFPVINEERNKVRSKKLFATYSVDKNKSILDKARIALKNGVCLFLGAGVSKSAGVVTWDNLLEQLCVKKGLAKIDSDIDNVIKGRYIIDEYRQQQQQIPDNFYEDMRGILYANIQPSPLIDAITDLVENCNVESIVSYNYDDLVEQKVNSNKKKLCHSVFDKSRPNSGDEVQVYHVHGFIPQSGNWSPIVLGEKEYHKIYQEAYNWSNVEQLHSLCRSVCFFIGLSMNDPNLRRLIDVSIDGSEIEAVHYAFLRRIEYDVPFMEKIMRGFGINCIWYDEHRDLPGLIKSLI